MITRSKNLREDISKVLDKHRIYVAAAYKAHFISWCEENGVDFRHPNVRHVYSRIHLIGIRKVPLFLAYGWWKSEETHDAVMEYCAMNNLNEQDLPRALLVSYVTK